MNSNTDNIDNTWEKCTRLLLINIISKLLEFQQLIEKIFDNIIKYPNEMKFRRLKYSNNSIKTKLLDLSGGLDLLFNVGFEMDVDEDGGKSLHFKAADEIDLSNFFQGIKDWLNETINSCEIQSKSTDSCCADCIINIKLPTGTSVYGGFMKHEKLANVLSYACCYFKFEKYNDVSLISPITRVRITPEELTYSLSEMKMFPRAVIMTSVLSEEDSSALLSKVANDGKEKLVKEKKKIMVEKSSQKNIRQALEVEKARILNEFKDDRNR